MTCLSRILLLRFLLIAPFLLATPPLLAANLLPNGNFEDGTAGWWTNAGEGGAASFAVDSDAVEGSQSLKVAVSTLGSNSWSIQAISSDWAAQTDREYQITFWAKAAVAGGKIQAVIQDQSYGNQATKDQALTTEWTRYSWIVSPGNTPMDFVIRFISTGTFWIDDIVIDAEIPAASLVLTPAERHQTMIGFGGALTWYADRIMTSPHTKAIQQLIFEDLGIDIIRFQNWYFPNNYPDNTDPAGMPDSSIWENTAAFYNLAKTANPQVKILLSSWGPPAALKSNNDTSGGTLKKINGEFVYDQYAQYWVDTFDHLPFVPDYLSIQNEPGYVASWTTCEWRPSETAELPGYDKAIDAVHNALRDRPRLPEFIGAEVENIGPADWNGSLNMFREFTTPLKSRDFVGGYAYHLYNIWSLGQIDSVIPNLNLIRDEFGEKPSFMTEYSSTFAGWLETARIIQNTLIEADTSAYIHWNMVWGVPSDPGDDSAMITVSYGGDYAVQENYFLIKHFSKFINAGYIRVGLSGSDESLRVSAFLRPDGRRLVIQAVNAAALERNLQWDLTAIDISSAIAIRSTEGNYFNELGSVDLAAQTSLPAESMTTYVIDLGTALLPEPEPLQIRDIRLVSPGGEVSVHVNTVPGLEYALWRSSDLSGNWTEVAGAAIDVGPEETILTDATAVGGPVFYQVRGQFR